MQTRVCEGLVDLSYMLVVTRLKNETEEAAIYILGLASALVADGNDVSTVYGDYLGNLLKLSGLIHKLDTKLTRAPRFIKTALDNA